MLIEFSVPSIPVAQPRQRHRVIQSAGRAFASNYTPKDSPVNAFKAAVQLAAVNALGSSPPLDCPIRMDVVFVFPRPANVRKKDGNGRLPHTGKPDRDNLLKSLQDSMNGIAYRDDSLIYDGRVTKFKASSEEGPHVEVRIETF